MAFPDTPVSLISRLKDPGTGTRWQDSWRKFFDLYHGAIRASVLRAYSRHNWSTVPEVLLQDTIAEVVVAFCQVQQKTAFDPTKGQLRAHLCQLAAWKVADQIRRQQRSRSETPIQHPCYADESPAIQQQQISQWQIEIEARENAAYQAALLNTLLDDARARVSPRSWLIFDLVKLQHKAPDEVANEFRVHRHIVDNAVYKVVKKLKELASNEDYRKEITE